MPALDCPPQHATEPGMSDEREALAETSELDRQPRHLRRLPRRFSLDACCVYGNASAIPFPTELVAYLDRELSEDVAGSEIARRGGPDTSRLSRSPSDGNVTGAGQINA